MKKQTESFSLAFLAALSGLMACPLPGSTGFPPGYIEPYSVATNIGDGTGGLLLVEHEPPYRDLGVSFRREFGEGDFKVRLVSEGSFPSTSYSLEIEHDDTICSVALDKSVKEGRCYRRDGESIGEVRLAAFPTVNSEAKGTDLAETTSQKWIYGIPAHQLFDGAFAEVEQRWQERYVPWPERTQ